jgi:hypothetical protein
MPEAAVEEPQTLARAVAHPHRQIPHASFAVGSAGGIRAAKSGELVHGQSSPTLACVGSTSLPRGQLWQPSFSSSITTGHQRLSRNRLIMKIVMLSNQATVRK